VDQIGGEEGVNSSSLMMEEGDVVRPELYRKAVTFGTGDGHLVMKEGEEDVAGFESTETCTGKKNGNGGAWQLYAR
jgi:hypothetical protein